MKHPWRYACGVAALGLSLVLVWALNPYAGCRTGTADAQPTATIDFFQASGLSSQQLAAWLQQQSAAGQETGVPLELTLHNEQGDLLVQGRVQIVWKSGRHRLIVSRSGIVGFALDQSKLDGLQIVAPAGYTVLHQRTIPLGSAYAPDEEPAPEQPHFSVCYDHRIVASLKQHLLELRDSGHAIGYEELRAQLRRRQTRVPLATPADRDLTPAEIYQQCKSSVVVVSSLEADGKLLVAGGVVVEPSGVILTAYHVIDKPSSIAARGILMADGRFAALQEVLAADPAADLCLLRVDATGLPAAPVSPGDPEGSPITVISHPGMNFFSLTPGCISRYWAQTSYGRTVVTMAITAEFADGASGGPVFNARGAVTGIISYTVALGNQMVLKECGSAREIRRLCGAPSAGGDGQAK